MARKTREDKEQTRQNILNAALELFHEKGYTGTTLDQIARSAGVTRGAIYWHFQDKVDLFLGLKGEIELSARMRLEDRLLWPVESLADMGENVSRFFRQMEKDERFRRYFEMVIHRAEFTEELQPVLAQYRDKLRRLQQKDEEDLNRLKQVGKVREEIDCAHAALGFRCLFIGIIHTWALDNGLFSLTRQGAAMLNEYLEGLAP